MSSSQSLTSIDVSEYDRIEAAMSESERGRWFLDAYLRRNRAHDTGILLDAIARLEKAVTGEREQDQIGRVRGDLMDMAHAIARTKAEIAAISAPDHDQSRLGGASAALDAIVRSTERATSEILSSAEHVQEAAWILRESGSDAEICDELDRRATSIYTACSFQDLTAQRTARIIHTLRYLEERLAAMMAIWGDALETVPPAPGESQGEPLPTDLCQSDVDRYIDGEVSSGEADTPVAVSKLPEHLSVDDDIVFLEATDAVPPVASAATPRVEPEPEPADFTEAEAPAVEVPETDAEPLHDILTEPTGDVVATPTDDLARETVAAHAETDDPESGFDPAPSAEAPVPAPAAEATTHEPDEDSEPAPMADPVALKMAASAAPAQTDIASAFAEIDALSDDEKRALFS
ncbi:ribonuclease E domain-containing protein [Methylobacterium goesingense]|uniref:Chemotaxis protein CheZ n=1 Tax=Methylobacterium goesingense TaxID=243690 RepID=A0ABV2L515_9HYPH|nr:hypothetical protein [Methylobacterium goesingense]GJD73306.1 hypothetical protein CFIICLFH_1533 [Methylobacterium goesingense]